jgi:hypothetical protein
MHANLIQWITRAWRKGSMNIPVGTFDTTFERITMRTARTAIPLAWLICAKGSTNSHKQLGNPVLLKPSIVINIPQKRIKRE